MTLEARACGLAGIVIWELPPGYFRLVEIRFPVFYGMCPRDPKDLTYENPDALTLGRFGTFSVGKDDVTFADDDGVLLRQARTPRKLFQQPTRYGKGNDNRPRRYGPA